MADFSEFNPAIKYGATIGTALNNTVSGDLAISTSGVTTVSAGVPFQATVSCGTASGSVGCVILADALVTQSRSAYLHGFTLQTGLAGYVSSTASTGSSMCIEDTTGSIFVIIGGGPQNTILDGNYAKLGLWTISQSASVGTVSAGTSFIAGIGSTPGKGLMIRTFPVGGTIASGSNFTVTVWGVLK